MPRTIERLHPERAVKLQAVKSPRTVGGPFADLTWTQQRVAEQWLFKFCARWGNDLPGWRRAILIGVAKRLAKNPPAANFAKSLHGHIGGRTTGRLIRAGLHDPFKFRRASL